MCRREQKVFLVQHTGKSDRNNRFRWNRKCHSICCFVAFIFNAQDCPESEPDFRHQQCSEFDEAPFEGIRYEWVPYLKAPNPCELNCMPRGERFYYRHKAKVTDGTRCNDETNDVCVDGQCQVSVFFVFFFMCARKNFVPVLNVLSLCL